MNTDRQIQGKRAEMAVIGELLRLGVVPYLTLADVEGVDAIVSVNRENILKIQVKASGIAGGKGHRWFQVPKVEVSDNFFIIGVEAPRGVVGDMWIFPSKVFDAYATLPPRGTPRDLNLNVGKKKYGQPLSEILCVFKNRWELITKYERYKTLLNNPEDLKDTLAIKGSTGST